jgi:2,5-diketo-D-gluconate reductase A
VCNATGVALESYSTLGTGKHVDDRTVAAIAERHARTPAQVLLRWCVQLDVPVIPKSTHQERIVENSQIFDFELSEDDMNALNALDRTGGTGRALDRD